MKKIKNFCVNNKRLLIFIVFITFFIMFFNALELFVPIVLFSTVIHLLLSLKKKRRKGKTFRRLMGMFIINIFLFSVMFVLLRMVVFYQFIYILPTVIQFSILIGIFQIVYPTQEKIKGVNGD